MTVPTETDRDWARLLAAINKSSSIVKVVLIILKNNRKEIAMSRCANIMMLLA